MGALNEERKMVIDVPYSSQWDKDGQKYRGDCGPACLKMMLARRGVEVTIDELSDLCNMENHPYSTSGSELISAAAEHGLVLIAKWGFKAIDLREVLPCIVLVHYGSIPECDRQDVKYTGGHWMVVVGIENDQVIYHDPDWSDPRRIEGAYRRLTTEQFGRAFEGCYLDMNPIGYVLYVKE